MTPQLVVLAGPNGAGKSTFYAQYLAKSSLPFLNADRFAAQINVNARDAAAILDATRDEMIERGLGFITETVFSDPVGAKLAMLQKALDHGYEVTLIFIGLPSPELCALRIQQRVAEGGHDVPADRIRRRYEASLDNLEKAIAFVPTVKVYDNSSVAEPHRLVAAFHEGERTFAARAVPPWAKRFAGR